VVNRRISRRRLKKVNIQMLFANYKDTVFVPFYTRRLVDKLRSSLKTTQRVVASHGLSVDELIKLQLVAEYKSFWRQQKKLPYSEYQKLSVVQKSTLFTSLPVPGQVLTVKCQIPIFDFSQFSTCFVNGGLLTGRTPINYRWSSITNLYQNSNVYDHERLSIQRKNQLLPERRLSPVVELFKRHSSKPSLNYYNNGILLNTINMLDTYYLPPNLLQNVERPEKSLNKLYRRLSARTYLAGFESNNTWLAEETRLLISQIFKKLLHRRLPEYVLAEDRFIENSSVPRYLVNTRTQFPPLISGYTGRYPLGVNQRLIDRVLVRHQWSTAYRGSIMFNRDWLLSGGRSAAAYNQQLKTLTNQYYGYQNWLNQYHTYTRYTQVTTQETKFKKLTVRRFFQRRRVRLRRAMERTTKTTIEQHLSQQPTTSYYRVNRQPSMEQTQVTNPSFISYLVNENRFRTQNKLQTFNAYYYLYFGRKEKEISRKRWRFDKLRVYFTKSGRSRMRVFQDHPVLGPPNKQTRTTRLSYVSWFITSKRVKKKLTQTSIKSVSYWGNIFYCSGLDTRRKLDVDYPEGRRLSHFFLSFISGYAVEKKQKKVFSATIGNYFSFNRSSLTSECLSAIEQRPTINPLIMELKNLPSPIEVPPVNNRFQTGLRWLTYYVWFYFLTPVWWVYYFYARVIVYVIDQLTVGGQKLFDECAGFINWYRYLLRLLTVEPLRRLEKRLRANRFIRILTWIYTSWVYLDLLHNDRYTLDHNEADTNSFDYEDEEVNYDLDYDSEEDDTDYNLELNEVDQSQYQPTLFGNPLFEWYTQNMPNDTLEELYDEASYFVRLVVRPFCNLIYQLPVWVILDWASLWGRLLKAEFNRTWYKILTHKNIKSRVVGRWWKIPLVVTKIILQYSVWVATIVYFLQLLPADHIQILIQYTLGLTWYEEYYYGYVCLAVVLSTLLVGPRSLKKFIAQDLGLDSLFYVLMIESALAVPEGYQPDRPMTVGYQDFNRLSIRICDKHESGDFLPVNSHVMDALPNQVSSYDDLRAVALYLAQPSNTNSLEDIPGNLMDPWRYGYEQRAGEDYTFNVSDRSPNRLTSDYFRGSPARTVVGSNYGQLVDPPFETRYKTTHSGDYYWNRTVYTRREWPTKPFVHQK